MRAFASLPLAASALVLGLACATKPAAPEVTFREQRVTNVTTFDLANCFPRELKVPAPVNQESLRAFLVSAQPQLNECLADPKHRGAEKASTIAVSATVTTEGAQFNAQSPNLTPAGAECISQALQKKGGLEPLPQGSKPVEASIDLPFQVGVNPAVVLGVNEASDALGRIRLSLLNWCDCFEPWKESEPALLEGNLVVNPPAKEDEKPTTEVTWQPAANEAATGVQSCLTDKIKALELTTVTAKLQAPLPVYFIHSSIDQMVAEQKPEVAIQQLYALRAQNLARLSMAPARRMNASTVYDATVKKYQANPKSVTVKELRDRCQDLLDADDAWIKALEGAISREEKAMQFLTAQQARDSSWKPEVDTAQKLISNAQTDLTTARETRQKDEAACPKVTWERR